MKKTILAAIIGGVILAGGSYWAGARFGIPGNNRDGQARIMRLRDGNPMGMRGRGGMMGGFTAGEVISADDKSITVKLPDGGSKIIFLTDATPVLKSIAGTRTDIAVGATVMVNGKPNQDGSISAESIQIRPLPAQESKPTQ